MSSLGAGSLEDLRADLHALARLSAEPEEISALIKRALEALHTLIPFDLAVAFRLEDGELLPLSATGRLAGRVPLSHSVRIDRYPTLKRALEERRPIALDAHHHHEEGDPFDGVLDLPPGHSCMVVPLYSGRNDVGVLTLDRRECETYSPAKVELAAVYGQLISLAIVLAEQSELLKRFGTQLKEQNRLLLKKIGGAEEACRTIEHCESPAMRRVVRMAQQIAPADIPVLIQGETGTGKEVMAQAIHAWSRRADGPFVTLNCAAIPEALIESELFGHVRGAFSGAEKDRLGRFRTANGGTLLLDEIGDLPVSAQARLLRVLQEGTFEPVGSDTSVRVDVRILAATHVDLEAATEAGTFRKDLYYRLAAVSLHLPPLRERREDIPRLANGYLERLARLRGPWTLHPRTLDVLRTEPWPGNIRELIHVLELVTLLKPKGTIYPEDLVIHGRRETRKNDVPMEAKRRRAEYRPRKDDGPMSFLARPGKILSYAEQERYYLQELLRLTRGRIYGPDGAAALAGLNPSTFRSKLVKWGLR